MDNTQLQYIKIQSQYIDKLEQFEKCIIKAKAAHSLADTAEKKCGQAWAALESGNMDVMRNTIQQYISRYGQDWARFRGVQIQRIDGYAYARLSAADLVQQLHCIIALVYEDTGLKSVSKEAFRECAKRLLKQSKIFTDKDKIPIMAHLAADKGFTAVANFLAIGGSIAIDERLYIVCAKVEVKLYAV